MQNIIDYFYIFGYVVSRFIEKMTCLVKTYLGGVIIKGFLKYHHVHCYLASIHIKGRPIINIGKNCKVIIGEDVTIASGIFNGIDNTTCSKINIKDDASLSIGNHTGMTNVVIQCHQSVTIGSYVNIGAGSMIFDTDFHSLFWKDRQDGTDITKRAMKPVVIKDYVFIGAHSFILKGVTIGEKSIVGAGSVVTRDIPDGEIWAGNPARFIKRILE